MFKIYHISLAEKTFKLIPSFTIMQQISVAFWNLQNLFGIEANEVASDLEFTPEQGWNEDVLTKKWKNLYKYNIIVLFPSTITCFTAVLNFFLILTDYLFL